MTQVTLWSISWAGLGTAGRGTARSLPGDRYPTAYLEHKGQTEYVTGMNVESVG